jgi:hypothetical protein
LFLKNKIFFQIPLELVYTSAIVPVGAAAAAAAGVTSATAAVTVTANQSAQSTSVVTPPATSAGRTYSPTELQ